MSRGGGDDGKDMLNEFQDAISRDDKSKFIALVNEVPARSRKTVCLPYIWQIFLKDAVECAKALLCNETGLTLNIIKLDKDGAYPLHVATDNLSYSMVDLLLHHGARTDVRTVESEFVNGNLLPLNMAVEMLSRHPFLIKWTPSKSIFKLILLLCLPQMKAHLEVCKLLAKDSEKVGEFFMNFVLDGKLVEMAGLLMVAREKVMDPRNSLAKDFPDVVEDLIIQDRIAVEIALLTNKEVTLLGRPNNKEMLKLVKKKKELLRKAMLLLNVFEKIGPKIEKYTQTPTIDVQEELVKDIKMLTEGSRIVLKDKHIDLSDIDCSKEQSILKGTTVLYKKMGKKTLVRSKAKCSDGSKYSPPDKISVVDHYANAAGARGLSGLPGLEMSGYVSHRAGPSSFTKGSNISRLKKKTINFASTGIIDPPSRGMVTMVPQPFQPSSGMMGTVNSQVRRNSTMVPQKPHSTSCNPRFIDSQLKSASMESFLSLSTKKLGSIVLAIRKGARWL